MSSPIIGEGFKSRIFGAFLEEMFQPGSSQCEPQSSKWADALKVQSMALKKCKGRDGKILVNDLATMFPAATFLEALSCALEALDSGVFSTLKQCLGVGPCSALVWCLTIHK